MKPLLALTAVTVALLVFLELQLDPADDGGGAGVRTARMTAQAEPLGGDTIFSKKDVPYVPTLHESVDTMLRMAEVSSDDVVYDLGSGDGRIVIAAASDYGARGVGIDIDPVLVFEARENAEKAGVADRVELIEGDLFDADLRDATVVTLYLLPAVNLRLRPKLLRELDPGTPVVSHDFSMGEWEPDAVEDVGEDQLYLWIVPADVGGVWRWTDLQAVHTATFDQEFQKVDGTIRVGNGGGWIRGGRVDGEELTFEIGRPDGRGGKVVERYSGRVLGDRLEGTITAGGQIRRWTASR